jgi:hypothetical protein
MVARQAFVLAVALVALQLVAAGHVVAGEQQGEKIDLRILYAGQPGSDREREFLGFLREHFVEVGEADLREFGESQAKGFGVVILDWDGKDLRAPRPKLSQSYARATVTVGVPGAMICGNLNLKSGYL